MAQARTRLSSIYKAPEFTDPEPQRLRKPVRGTWEALYRTMPDPQPSNDPSPQEAENNRLTLRPRA